MSGGLCPGNAFVKNNSDPQGGTREERESGAPDPCQTWQEMPIPPPATLSLARSHPEPRGQESGKSGPVV